MTDVIAGFTVNFRRRLGRGAIGNVYKATDKGGKPVAAKQVDSSRSEKSAIRELENAQRHVMLTHENIVKIFHILNEEDIWVFMEYCEGGDLNNYSKEKFHELQDNKISIMHQISKGLAFLHSCRIAYRDIKPENVLIQPNTEFTLPTVKLTDFGLAKYRYLDPQDTTSAMETKLGTRLYMAPEFYNQNEKGKIKYHKDVDVYALGLTFAAIISAEEGQNLKPTAVDCEKTEWAQPIGLAMVGRHDSGKPQLIVVQENQTDTIEIQTAKEIIRQATAFNPKERPTAKNIVEKFEALLPDEGNGSTQEISEEVGIQVKTGNNPFKGWSNIPYGFFNPFKMISWTPPTHPQILSTSQQKPVHLESQ